MLRIVLEKVYNIARTMDNESKEVETKKESKWNARNKKHYDRNAECFSWTHQYSREGWGVSELQGMSIETPQTEIQEKKVKEKEKQNRIFKNCRIITKSITYA